MSGDVSPAPPTPATPVTPPSINRSYSYTIHEPDSSHPSLSANVFPFDKVLGSWHIVASTLPMWKGKKNVIITYSPVPSYPPSERLDDLVTYQSRSAKQSSSPSTIRGVDKRDDTQLRDGKPGLESGARWKWRGKGWLAIASSRWQILSYNIHQARGERPNEPEYLLSYFKSTLFTPAGLDIYSRTPDGLSESVVNAIIESVKHVQDSTVAELGGTFFTIPHDPIPPPGAKPQS